MKCHDKPNQNAPFLRFLLLQTYILTSKTVNTLNDGWKWKPGGSCKLPRSKPLYRKSVYYYHSRYGVEKIFQRLVYERLDPEYVTFFMNIATVVTTTTSTNYV